MKPKHKRFLRYLAPNLVTLASLIFGMLSILAAVRHEYAASAWFVIFAVLTDKLDGFVARLVKGASEFGVQCDSFADFLNFGIAPATLWYTYLARPGSPVSSGVGYVYLCGSVILWVLAVTFRLARYNIVGDDPRCRRIFFGVPTTLAGGCLTALFLTFLKYGADVVGQAHGSLAEPHLAVSIRPSVWKMWPALVIVGAVLMASSVKIPKLGKSKSRILTVFIFANVILGYVLAATRNFPEYLCFGATTWILASIVWGQFSHEVKELRPPPIFPPKDVPASQMPQRPEEDSVPEDEEEIDHDEHPAAARR